MTTKDPLGAPDIRLPPVYVQVADPENDWWLGRRKALFMNAGLTTREIGPLLIQKPMPGTRLLTISGWFAAVGLALLVAKAAGVEAVSLLGAEFLIGACISFGLYALEMRRFRDTGNVWDQVRDLVFSVHGDKLIRLAAIPTTHARAEITGLIIQLAAARASILQSHVGDGPVPGEQELLHALAAVGELARHLQDDPDNTGKLEYSEIADSQAQARASAVDAMREFCALNPLGGSMLNPAELTIIAKGTRK